MKEAIVFMGTPDFSVPSLEALVHAGYDVRAVVTNPDRRAGRGRAPKPPPVKVAAQRLGLDVLQPPTLRKREVFESIQACEPVLFVVAAYGQILGPRYLAMPRVAPINVHASLLPKYRGAGPIQWSIIRGERETGVSIMKMTRGMDEGPVYRMRRVPIEANDTCQRVHDALSVVGAELLVETLPGILSGALEPTSQDDALATYAPKLSKAEGAVSFAEPAQRVHDRIRGVTPWPGACCMFRGQRVKLFETRCDADADVAGYTPGEVVAMDDHHVRVACASGHVLIGSLQAASRPRQPAATFVHGYHVEVGDRFEDDPRVGERHSK